jgi:predicted phosphohydrolase
MEVTMALYAIGDTHLSLGADKPMDIFGGGWEGYVDKLTEGFSAVAPDDTVVLCGDISWGMSLEEAERDFDFLNALPGKKILLKGNHDYWWTTASKMERFFTEHGFYTLGILHNNCHFYGEVALCGTRGWFYEETGSRKVFLRELIRLEASLKAAGDREKLCFLHYPPFYQGYTCQEIIDLLEKYAVSRCYYGHLHSGSCRLAVEGVRGGVEYHLISADNLNFKPQKIVD